MWLSLDKGLDGRRNNQDPEPGQGREDVAMAHRLILQAPSKHRAECLSSFGEENLMVCALVAVQE